MSRIGKMPISVPQGVKVEIQGTYIKAGAKGVLERTIRPEIELKLDNDLLVAPPREQVSE